MYSVLQLGKQIQMSEGNSGVQGADEPIGKEAIDELE
jgi:hypothetical protein